ncbi:hypothetical protein CPB84DRAFT_1840863 [Gymnopilus junonius]|uniref:Uncharacterized protein n=1 Tax=Gymnopilus junonius TaxID=109634 RepID=A0A9P5P389_GYMJU|nr:hypothetical protein CPB84DRAFT_1840863 [Gymnopilus junonius]
MPLSGSSSTHRHHHSGAPNSGATRRQGFFHRRDRDRVAGGYKAALSHPNSTHNGRKHAIHELRIMGRGDEAHVSFMTKIRRVLGIRSTPRRQRVFAGESRY